MADDPTQQDGFGLNKAARLQQQRADQQQSDTPPPLDPDFPYRVEPFDPLFFGAFPSHPPTS